MSLPAASFDAVVSWLAIVHIPERPRLLAHVAQSLRPGGGCYIEDLCMRAPFSSADARDLRTVVYGLTATTIADYVDDLRAAGFADVQSADLTPDWAPFAASRLAAWRQNRDAYSRVHGDGAYAAQEHFYAVISRLYDGGSLGGVRVTGRVIAQQSEARAAPIRPRAC